MTVSILGSTRGLKQTWTDEFPGKTINAEDGKEVRCPAFRHGRLCGRLICKIGIKCGWIEFVCPRCKEKLKIVLMDGK